MIFLIKIINFINLKINLMKQMHHCLIHHRLFQRHTNKIQGLVYNYV